MTKLVVSTRCMDEQQYERIVSLIGHNVQLTKAISSRALGHDVVVHDGDVIESALLLENTKLAETLKLLEEKAG